MPDSTHPYYPTTLFLPNYVPPTRTFPTLVFQSLLLLLPMLVVGSLLLRRRVSRLTYFNRWEFRWFVYCSFSHLVMDGYYLYYDRELVGRSDILGELWKEYAKCDSRYISQEVTIVMVKFFTVTILGPLCLITCLLILNNSLRYHLLTILVSVGHIYNSVILLLSNLLTDNPYSDPHLYYRLIYLYSPHLINIIIPTLLIYRSTLALSPHLTTTHFSAKKSAIKSH